MNRIATYIAAGEGARAQKLALAIAEDPRFEPLQIDSGLPVDVMFSLNEIKFLIELKECADYVTSALSPSGHLYDQHLKLRESGHRSMILVLGGDKEISDAISSSLWKRYKGDQLRHQIASYEDRLHHFDAVCFGLGIPVMRWKAAPFKRLLSVAYHTLTDGSLMDYRPRPANGERELAAASLLFHGMGPKVMGNILKEYTLCFAPRGDYAKPIDEIEGIGRKRADQIGPYVRMTYMEKIKV